MHIRHYEKHLSRNNFNNILVVSGYCRGISFIHLYKIHMYTYFSLYVVKNCINCFRHFLNFSFKMCVVQKSWRNREKISPTVSYFRKNQESIVGSTHCSFLIFQFSFLCLEDACVENESEFLIPFFNILSQITEWKWNKKNEKSIE